MGEEGTYIYATNCTKCHDDTLKHLRHSYMASKYDIGPMEDQWPSGAASGDHISFPETSQMGPGALMRVIESLPGNDSCDLL